MPPENPLQPQDPDYTSEAAPQVQQFPTQYADLEARYALVAREEVLRLQTEQSQITIKTRVVKFFQSVWCHRAKIALFAGTPLAVIIVFFIAGMLFLPQSIH